MESLCAFECVRAAEREREWKRENWTERARVRNYEFSVLI